MLAIQRDFMRRLLRSIAEKSLQFVHESHVEIRKVDRTGFFIPTSGRVFGCLHPKEIPASRDFLGEFGGRLLPESPMRPTLIVQPRPATL